MKYVEGITIVVCTRNRPDDLDRCIGTISKQILPCNLAVEVLVLDDGDLDESMLKRFQSMLMPCVKFRYHKKTDPGLLLSRITALNLASFDIVLFLDDDVELAEDYLCVLKDSWELFDDSAGIGGIDTLLHTGYLWRAYNRLICYKSGNPGKLSLSGCNGSIMDWVSVNDYFESDFLSGCNMSFRKSSLVELKPVKWLNSYSAGEDIYLSLLAKQKGRLIVNPALKVVHNRSEISRDRVIDVASSQINNNYRLFKLTNPKWWQYIVFLWTFLGRLSICLPYRNSWPKALGYIKGFKSLITMCSRRNHSRHSSD